MPRFDVYRNNGEHAEVTPYLLDVQSDLLQGLETRIVVPLRRRDRFPVTNLPTKSYADARGRRCRMPAGNTQTSLCAASFVENANHIPCIQAV